MEDNTRTWLADIKQAIREIDAFLPDNADFLKFKEDLKTKRAIERNIEIIGEAINRIIKANPKASITNARKIVDTRNRLIHGYDTVSEDIIWAIVIRDLTLPETEIDKLISKA